MEKEIANIDDFIKQGLSDFQAPPPADAWDTIARQVQKPNQKLIPMFWRWAAVAAIIIGLGFILKTQFQEPDTNRLSKTEAQKKDYQEKNIWDELAAPINDNLSDLSLEKQLNQNRALAADSKKPKTVSEQKANLNHPTEKVLAQSSEEKIRINSSKAEKIRRIEKKNLIAENPAIDKEQGHLEIEEKNITGLKEPPVVQDQKSVVIVENQTSTKSDIIVDKNSTEEAIPGLPKDLYAENKQQANWSVGGGVSPVYSFRNLNKKEGENSYTWPGGENNEQNERPIVAFSGGLDVEYNARRWSVSAGIYYSQNGQETDHFNFNRIIIFNSQTNIYASTSAGNIAYEQVASSVLEYFDIDGKNPYLPNALESEPIESEATLRQDFEYLEVPFMAKYKLIDRKIDVQFLAGVSTSFLMGNSNVLQYSGKELDMGKIENLRSVNYNSLVGLGFQYPFTRSLRFRLQPMFKYALKPINEEYSINSFPYSFAVYTGIAFDF